VKFKIASSILVLFTLIGLGVIIFSDFETTEIMLICFVLYVLIPAYGAYGTFVQSRNALLVSFLFFVFQSIRQVDDGNLIPHIAPITVSFPFGDFSNGQGYLIDFFAIFMAIFLGWLLKVVISPSKVLKSDS